MLSQWPHLVGRVVAEVDERVRGRWPALHLLVQALLAGLAGRLRAPVVVYGLLCVRFVRCMGRKASVFAGREACVCQLDDPSKPYLLRPLRSKKKERTLAPRRLLEPLTSMFVAAASRLARALLGERGAVSQRGRVRLWGGRSKPPPPCPAAPLAPTRARNVRIDTYRNRNSGARALGEAGGGESGGAFEEGCGVEKSSFLSREWARRLVTASCKALSTRV